MSIDISSTNDVQASTSWEWVRGQGTHGELARFVSASAVRGIQLVAPRGLNEKDRDVASRLYGLLRDQRVGYAPEPHLHKVGAQQIRDPWLLARNKVGTCIDFATTYAAMCLDAAIRPLLAVTDEHAFVVVAPERMLAEPHPEEPILIDGFAQAEYEHPGVLQGDATELIGLITRGDLIAIDSTEAKDGGQDFTAALPAALLRAQESQLLLLVDVHYLQHQPGFEPLEAPAGHRPIHNYVPADDSPFVDYQDHLAVIEELKASSGTVVLLGRPGQGKSRVARELARTARLGGAWFLDASGPQALINSLSAVDLAGRAQQPTGRARLDREGFAQNARALLGETKAPWIVVLDNADDDPGRIEHLMPRPDEGQLVLVTSTKDVWKQVPGVKIICLQSIPSTEIVERRRPDDPDVTELLELIDGLPLLLGAFLSLMRATGWDAATVASHAPTDQASNDLQGQATLWAALRSAQAFGDRELLASGYSAYLPPDHQPLAAFELLDPGTGEKAARVLADHGLLAYELEVSAKDRATLRLHRTFGTVIRTDLEKSAGDLCDTLVQRLASEHGLYDLLDVHGDFDTITRLAGRLEQIDEAKGQSLDPVLGTALHGIAGLLELHGQTRQSGDVFARAEARLDEDAHRTMVADCRHGRARTVNQHHQKDEALLRDAVGWAQSARQILGRNGDHCLAMEGLLRQKLAAFPAPGETEFELLNDALALIEEADERRNRPDSGIDPAELARSRFNLAGVRIRLARSWPEHAETYLEQAREIYEDVRSRRREIYRRDVHPHIAACIIGLAYVDYFRALLIPADYRQRTQWLRRCTERAMEALEQRSALEGSIDSDEVAKVSSFLAKVMLARASAPVAAASVHEAVYEEAMGELGRAGIALARVPPLPSTREQLPAAIDAWVRSPALRTLLTEFGQTLPVDLPLGALLAWLEDFSIEWDYRKGKERNLVDMPQFSPIRRKVVLAAAEALGLISAKAKQRKSESHASAPYDEVLILGGLVRGCLARPLHAAKLLREGAIEATSVTALGGFRAIAGDEVGLLDRVLGQEVLDERVDDEFHAMDAGVRNAFDLTAMVDERGEDSDVLGASWRVREYSTTGGMPVRVVAAPSTEPGVRRSNTPDTYAWFATELAKLQPGQRLLIVTTDIYVPFQHAEALRMLALPYRITADAVGVEPGSVHPGLRQEFKPHNYLQEIRSTIMALHTLYTASCDDS